MNSEWKSSGIEVHFHAQQRAFSLTQKTSFSHEQDITMAQKGETGKSDITTRSPSQVANTEELHGLFRAALNEYPELAESDGGVELITRVLNATTMEEVLGDNSSAESMEDYVDKVIRVESFSIQESDPTYLEQGALPWYAVIHGRDMETQENQVWTTGATKIVAQLVSMYRLKAFPELVTVKARSTRKGTMFYLTFALK